MRRLFSRVVAPWVLALPLAAAAGSYDDYFRAVAVDDAGTVSALLARGFDPNTVDEQGQVGLFIALRGDAPKVAALLIAHPAIQVDQPNPIGETPLMMAALRGGSDWAERLLARGAQVNREGWTPLHYAASGPEPKLVALLIGRGAKVDARSPNGTTPLMMAARYGSELAVFALLARGADAKLRNDRQLDAADFARLAGRDTLATRLTQAAR